MSVDINWLAVVVGTIGYMVLGALWYGPLFGSIWMDAMVYSGPEDVDDENATLGYAVTTVGSFVAAVALAVLVDLVGVTSWQTGLGLGALVGLGFVATTGVQAVPFEDRPWAVYTINTAYNVVALAGIGVLVAVW